MSQALTALGSVLAALVLLRLALRFGGLVPPRGGAGALRVVESCALGARQRLHVVEAGGERLLIAAGEGGVRCLRRLPPAPATPAAQRSAEGALEAAAPSRIPEPQQGLRAGRAPLRGFLRALRLAALGALVLGTLAARPAQAEAPAAPAAVAAAGSALPAPLGSLGIPVAELGKPDRIATTLQIVALVTLVSVAPSILLMATCFTRIVIVFALLRQAVGLPQLPPNQVLVGLALFTTLFVMAPVGKRIESEALTPYMARELDEPTALARAGEPVREFLLAQTRHKDLELFVGLSGQEPPAEPGQVGLATLLPAFMISELRTAFEIGFMIYLPFLVVDLVIASMLISMGMIVLPPIVISLPFKLMLFVLLDGWNLVLGSLVAGLR